MTNSDFQLKIVQAAKIIANRKAESRIFKLSVKKRFDGFTLIDLYSQSFPHVPYSFWETKILNGNLLLDGKKSSPLQKVKAGQITQHSVPPKEEPSVNFNIDLIHATDTYWVINKPSPLPVHAGGRYQLNTLTNLLRTAFPNQGIHLINRLDANTTGIVLVALNKEKAQLLGKQFENREVTKTYLALVEGEAKHSHFLNEKSVGKLKTAAGGRALAEGKASQTEFEILKKLPKNTLLKVTPHSGRTNQIRLHLADLGLPIVGDLGYAQPAYFETNPLTYPTDTLFLHAWKLTIIDQEKKVEFVAKPNEKWDYLLL
tara:strand:+ start:8288 stop:9232 length:945 start_codon:yes stop_codon:yes gene_type:complete